jgi:tetratricopeptide (TPR) repeat protein
MMRLLAMLRKCGEYRDRLSLWLENHWFAFWEWWEERGGLFKRWRSQPMEQRETPARSWLWRRAEEEEGLSRREQVELWLARLDKLEFWHDYLVWYRCQRQNLTDWLIEVRPWYYRHGLHCWLRALPALAAGLAGLGLAVTSLIFTPERIEARYAKTADQALAEQNYPQAQVASQRLMQLNDKNPAHILRLARSLAGAGQVEGAVALAATVAPMESVGNIPAQLLIAGILLNSPTATPAALRMAEQRLRMVLAVEPDCAEAQALVGLCCFRTGQWGKAREVLEKVYPQRHEAALLLSITASMLGRPADVQYWAEAASRHFQSECRDHPYLWLPRLKWAEAEVLLGHPTNALEILEAGLKQLDHRSLRQRAARLIAERVARSLQEAPTDTSACLEWTWRGLGHDEQNEFLLRQLIRLLQAADPDASLAWNHLRELGRKTENLVLIHFCRGMDAWEKGDLAAAHTHLLEAYELDPENLVIANNLAWLWACLDPPDYEHGLQLINRVLERNPNAPVPRDTKGQLLMKLGRWQEAAAELEQVLPQFQNHALFQANLAAVYQKLGKTELSKKHAQLARQIAARQAVSRQ